LRSAWFFLSETRQYHRKQKIHVPHSEPQNYHDENKFTNLLMSAAIIKRLDVARVNTQLFTCVQRWVAAFDILTQDVLFLQEKLTNLRAIHSVYHTKIDELFAVVPDDKIDKQTAKVILHL
jgi:hypothetical protein